MPLLISLGFSQSFGVFQAHYGREAAAREGVLREAELAERALISSIGSLGNGGLVAVFGMFYYPHLPQLGKQIRTLCFVGTICISVGLATATTSRNVRWTFLVTLKHITYSIQVWTLFGCQGIVLGLGAGILINVLAPILPEYFPRRSGLAQGTMYAGKGLCDLICWSTADRNSWRPWGYCMVLCDYELARACRH